MSDTTVTIRGVDSKTWKDFQSSIINLHGNLYGNIGEEATNALTLWLDRYKGRKAVVSIPADQLSITYEDIGGLKDEIKVMKEVVEMPLKHPELFKWLSLIPPKGVLIYGPPGTGKNLLAKVAASKAKANLYILHVQRILNEFNEVGLCSVFQVANETPPSVILIPDLEAIAVDSQHAPRESVDQVTSCLLSEIDALGDSSRVIVIGIASSPDKFQPSFMQRFGHKIEVSFPNRQGRCEILKITTRNMPLANDVDIERLAEMTDKHSGILLWRICQEAARHALRRTLEQEELTDEKLPQKKLEQIKIGMDDFLHALKIIKTET